MKSMLYKTPSKTVSRMAPPKTPMNRQNSADTITDPVQVHCRVRPTNNSNEISCVKVISDKTVCLRPPEMSANYKITAMRETQYTFQKVFKPTSTQREVYEHVAQPLVEDLIKGKNGLLFTYGVTSSGKTYTMTGNQDNRGVMPRCLESLFKTISSYQAKKFVFKPDRMNGFEILSDAEAMQLQQEEMIARFGKNHRRKDSDPEIASEASAEASILQGIDEDSVYAVFITYIEVYNNSVYDLLEDGPIQKTLQTKIIRSDGNSNMYVHGVTEIEVKTVKEAIDAYHMGQKRKRTGHTLLNSESSRSHSVFTIRLVQAPTDSQGELTKHNSLTISQLSLVDLAGSERTNRTNNTGQRLREAGNINNSLMTLRKCLEILRENQTSSATKKVPYRDARITHLFKNYFDGEGHVRMIVCINPRQEDFDETTQVMKFAEMTQEVQVARPTPMKMDNGFTPGRRKANQIFKIAVQNLEDMGRPEARKLDLDIGLVYSLGPKFPDYCLISPETDELIVQLMLHLDQRIQKRSILLDDYNARQNDFRMKLVRTEQEMNELRIKNLELGRTLEYERTRNQSREKKIESLECTVDELKRKLHERESIIKDLQTQNNQKQCMLKEMEVEQNRQKRRFESKIAHETEKTSRQLAREYREKEEALNDCIRSKQGQMRRIQKILNLKDVNDGDEAPANKERNAVVNAATSTPRPNKVSTHDFATPRTLRGIAVANPRHRRSKSTDDRWLEHRAQNPVPLGTILQPFYASRPKSITKLTDAKDIVNAKTSKYCLVSQGADTDGEVETRLYKGNVIPTCGGGAQVVFNDVECLKQRSPVVSPRRKRSSDENTPMNNSHPDEVAARCSIGIQGSKKLKY